MLKIGNVTCDTPVIMGVLNVTPDSFSDGGLYTTPERALQKGLELIKQGAQILDIGGESTRPGAHPVSVQEELDRVIPVIERLVQRDPIAISVDTSQPAVMQAAAAAGAHMINDVRALQRDSALSVAKATGLPVCLMHMQKNPAEMQINPRYNDVIADIKTFFQARLDACENAGIQRSQLLLDPGFGFGKTLQHNLILLARLAELRELGLPLLVGLSRKSMIGTILDKPVNERIHGSVTAAMYAIQNGATIVRVHDVSATADMIKILKVLKQYG